MTVAGRLHGAKALIYINGTELVNARGYSLDIAHDTAEGTAFGEVWKTVKGGSLGASGSIDGLLENDQKQLFTATTAGLCTSVNVMIYPKRTDIADVIKFDAYFGTSFAGDVGSIQTNAATFTVDGAVTLTGFA
jgi:hypothetical protein